MSTSKKNLGNFQRRSVKKLKQKYRKYAERGKCKNIKKGKSVKIKNFIIHG